MASEAELEELASRFDRVDLTREQFDMLVAQVLEVVWEAREITLNPLGGFSCKLPKHSGSDTVFTENLWAIFLDSEPPRYEDVSNFLRKALSDPSDEKPTRSQIVPLIRHEEWVGVAEGNTIAESFAGDLLLVYALDWPEKTTSLTRKECRELGLDEAELKEIAIANLAAKLVEVERHGDGPLYMITADGAYESSILLLDHIWDHVAPLVNGDTIASIPTRDVLLFTGSASREGLAALRDHTEKTFALGNYRISKAFLRRVSGQWRLY